MLHFSDGISIDTSGRYRVRTLPDGRYMVGHGMMIPTNSIEEEEKLFQEELIDEFMAFLKKTLEETPEFKGKFKIIRTLGEEFLDIKEKACPVTYGIQGLQYPEIGIFLEWLDCTEPPKESPVYRLREILLEWLVDW